MGDLSLSGLDPKVSSQARPRRRGLDPRTDVKRDSRRWERSGRSPLQPFDFTLVPGGGEEEGVRGTRLCDTVTGTTRDLRCGDGRVDAKVSEGYAWRSRVVYYGERKDLRRVLRTHGRGTTHTESYKGYKSFTR